MSRMKGFGIGFLVLLVMIGAWVAVAQDESAECTPETITDLLALIREQADTAEAESDPATALSALEGVGTAIGAARAACNGLSFSGDADAVLGPVTIPEGLYRAIATTDEHMIVQFAVVDGECGSGARMSASSLFILSDGDANEGAEAIFSSADCEILFEITNIGAPWTLVFEAVG